MKTYYVKNIRKAAQRVLDNDGQLYLRLINGMHGGTVSFKRYYTVAGLLRNSGRRVRAYFVLYSCASGASGPFSWSSQFTFAATY